MELDEDIFFSWKFRPFSGFRINFQKNSRNSKKNFQNIDGIRTIQAKFHPNSGVLNAEYRHCIRESKLTFFVVDIFISLIQNNSTLLNKIN
jgi:hypothetical protein